MKLTIKVKKEVDITTMLVKAKVRYWEDASVDGVDDEEGTLIPCRQGEIWAPEIDIDTGKIRNWEQGKKAKVHYKVCDQCSFYIKDSEGNIVGKQEGEYVPGVLCPKDSGYGDYIIMDIDENGLIDKWKFKMPPVEEDDDE